MEDQAQQTVVKTQTPTPIPQAPASERFSSRKFLMTIVGLFLVWAVYHLGVHDVNRALNDVRAGYIASMHNNFDYVAAAIILTFMGISGVMGVWNKTTQEVITTGVQAASEFKKDIDINAVFQTPELEARYENK